MHRFLASCGLLILTAAMASAQGKAKDANKFGWYMDFNAAKAEAKRTGKPIFVTFRCEP